MSVLILRGATEGSGKDPAVLRLLLWLAQILTDYFPSSLTILNFLSSFIDLKYSQIFLSFGGCILENEPSCYGDTLLQCWLSIGRKYQSLSWLQFSHSWHSQYPLSFQQFNSRKLLLNVFIKGSIVPIRLPIYLHQSYARQCRSLYAHLWRHKQIILAVSTNMLICYHSAFGKPIHQLHLMLAIEFHSSTTFWSINSGSSFLILFTLFILVT